MPGQKGLKMQYRVDQIADSIHQAIQLS